MDFNQLAGQDQQEPHLGRTRSSTSEAEQAFNATKVTEAAMPSVVTVYCGDSGGSGFVIDVADPTAGLPKCGDHQPSRHRGLHRPGGSRGLRGQGRRAGRRFTVLIGTRPTTWPWCSSPTGCRPWRPPRAPYGGSDPSWRSAPPTAALTRSPPASSPRSTTLTSRQTPPSARATPAARYWTGAGDVLGVTTFMLDPSQGANFAVRMRMRCEELLECWSRVHSCTVSPSDRTLRPASAPPWTLSAVGRSGSARSEAGVMGSPRWALDTPRRIDRRTEACLTCWSREPSRRRGGASPGFRGPAAHIPRRAAGPPPAGRHLDCPRGKSPHSSFGAPPTDG